MTNDKIVRRLDIGVKEILSHLSREIDAGALFIRGKAGSGKSKLIHAAEDDKELRKKYFFKTVSLFGIKDIGEMEKRVKESVFPFFTYITALLSMGVVVVSSLLRGAPTKIDLTDIVPIILLGCFAIPFLRMFQSPPP